jgi:hypothetical protein
MNHRGLPSASLSAKNTLADDLAMPMCPGPMVRSASCFEPHADLLAFWPLPMSCQCRRGCGSTKLLQNRRQITGARTVFTNKTAGHVSTGSTPPHVPPYYRRWCLSHRFQRIPAKCGMGSHKTGACLTTLAPEGGFFFPNAESSFRRHMGPQHRDSQSLLV